jgi:SpoIID/LytB domain protein
MCQAYGGVQAEKGPCTQAVLSTSGAILVYDGRPADVLYSQDCGGATEDYSATRPSFKAPYLCSVAEPEDVPHEEWEIHLPATDLQKMLLNVGVKAADGLTEVKVSKADASGRALEVEITGAGGAFEDPRRLTGAPEDPSRRAGAAQEG